MKNVNIVIMGKTGAGKSTIVNAILGEYKAKEGDGEAVTKENAVYETVKTVSNQEYSFRLCDTVGLEIDEKITNKTINDIEKHIDMVNVKKSEDDISLVWFCINSSSSRLENFEIDLMRKISFEREIPFIVVITQCYSEERGELEMELAKELPQNNCIRILAKDLKSKIGTFRATGLDKLIETSIVDYQNLKYKVLKNKLLALTHLRENRIKRISERAYSTVNDYTNKATKIGFIPGGCIPIIHGMLIKMIADINKICGLKGFAEDYIADFVVGLIATPFMAVPLLSAAVAGGYINSIGKTYTEALIKVIEKSSDEELKNNDIVAEKVKRELSRMKGERQ